MARDGFCFISHDIISAMDLTHKKCVPCEGGTAPLTEKEAREFMEELPKDWELVEGKEIRKIFEFKDFKGSISFVNKVAEIAEEEGHHPDITVLYDRVRIELSTHSIQGLSENDFIVAAKIEMLVSGA